MKASDFIVEVDSSYFQRIGNKLSQMSLSDALRVGNLDSNLREKAESFINLIKSKIEDLKSKPTQSNTEKFIKQIAYGEMGILPNAKSEQAIQELVDLVDNDSIDTNVAKTYMTQLVTMSLMKPQQDKIDIPYGEYLPLNMLETGAIVPVKYLKLKDNSKFVKFNGDWWRDTDMSQHQVKLHRQPVVDGYNKLEAMTGFDIPMRVGSGRTLEKLSQSEMDEWYSRYE